MLCYVVSNFIMSYFKSSPHTQKNEETNSNIQQDIILLHHNINIYKHKSKSKSNSNSKTKTKKMKK